MSETVQFVSACAGLVFPPTPEPARRGSRRPRPAIRGGRKTRRSEKSVWATKGPPGNGKSFCLKQSPSRDSATRYPIWCQSLFQECLLQEVSDYVGARSFCCRCEPDRSRAKQSRRADHAPGLRQGASRLGDAPSHVVARQALAAEAISGRTWHRWRAASS